MSPTHPRNDPYKLAVSTGRTVSLGVSTDQEEYALVAEKAGIQASSVPVRVHRLRQRYRELVRAEVAHTVSSPLELEEEMRHLFAVLNR